MFPRRAIKRNRLYAYIYTYRAARDFIQWNVSFVDSFMNLRFALCYAYAETPIERELTKV